MKLSIVTTLFNSEKHIVDFHKRASNSARSLVGNDYEIIFVNDGSPDSSLEKAILLTHKSSKVTVISLSRNFGHHKAMMTGLEYASGDLVFLVDSDLEEEPEWLSNFFAQKQQHNCDVVYGVQEFRKGNLFERLSGKVFYRSLKYLAGFELTENLVTARLMTSKYVKALILHKEREVFMAGLWHITGFAQIPQKVNKCNTSQTTYTLRHKLSLLINSVTSFSNTPLVSIFYIGFFIFLMASIYTLFLITSWFILAEPLSGWTSLMASIWLLGGLIISFIGVIGIYLAKVYSETKKRPYTIISEIYGQR